jgi:hypothetical protein
MWRITIDHFNSWFCCERERPWCNGLQKLHVAVDMFEVTSDTFEMIKRLFQFNPHLVELYFGTFGTTDSHKVFTRRIQEYIKEQKLSISFVIPVTANGTLKK